jgi:hypothetical protein
MLRLLLACTYAVAYRFGTSTIPDAGRPAGKGNIDAGTHSGDTSTRSVDTATGSERGAAKIAATGRPGAPASHSRKRAAASAPARVVRLLSDNN